MNFVSPVKRVLVEPNGPLFRQVISAFPVVSGSMLFGLSAYLFLRVIEDSDIYLDNRGSLALSPFLVSLGILAAHAAGKSSSISAYGFMIYTALTTFSALTVYVAERFSSGLQSTVNIVVGTGVLTAAFTTYLFPPASIYGLGISTAAGAATIGLFYILLTFFRPGLRDPLFFLPASSHYLDAASTFVALKFFGQEELRFLASRLIEIFGAGGVFILKTAVVLPVIYYTYNETEDPARKQLLFIIMAIGLTIAVRNAFLAG